MNTTPPNVSDNQEIDLAQISKKVSKIIGNVNRSLFNLILYVQRNFIFLLLLIVAGITVGYFLNGDRKYFENRIIVTPNYGSTNYLYSKIELVSSRIRNRDIKFLKSIGLSNKVKSVKIEAIIDVYRLANDSEKNYELLKLLSEESEFSKILKDETTSRNFKQHEITINSNSTLSNTNLKKFLKFLNSDIYYLNLQKEVLKNIKFKIKSNEYMINQIDNILNDFPKNSKSTNLVYNNENFNFNELIKFKNELLVEQGNRAIELLNYNEITKENSTILNISKKKSISNNYMIIVPLLFIMFLVAINIFKNFYKTNKRNFQERKDEM